MFFALGSASGSELAAIDRISLSSEEQMVDELVSCVSAYSRVDASVFREDPGGTGQK